MRKMPANGAPRRSERARDLVEVSACSTLVFGDERALRDYGDVALNVPGRIELNTPSPQFAPLIAATSPPFGGSP
jgi:hypothetical protein